MWHHKAVFRHQPFFQRSGRREAIQQREMAAFKWKSCGVSITIILLAGLISQKKMFGRKEDGFPGGYYRSLH